VIWDTQEIAPLAVENPTIGVDNCGSFLRESTFMGGKGIELLLGPD
jgi:hypothetical protein